jgi:hypothetical protein
VLEHALERSVLLQELGRGLVADPGDARDVVRGVPLQPDEVRNQLGPDTVTLDHALAVVHARVRDAARRGHDPNAAVVRELVGVAVPRHDHHVDALLLGLLGKARDHVVGLVAFDAHVAVAERLDKRLEVRPLLLKQVRPGLALRLVRLVRDLAAGHPGVPDDDRRLRPVLGEDLHEHAGEAEDRVGRLSP